MSARPKRVIIGFKPQPGPQVAFIKSPFDITVYGGSRGGGKTYATLGEFWLHAERHGMHAKGLMVRRSREDLKDTIEVAMLMYGDAAVWNDQKKFFRFRNGAVLHMAYLETDADAMNYQGWSLTRVYVEELTQYASPKGIFKLFATLRSTAGIKCQFRATTNPGGPGHHWVKEWVIDPGPMTPTTDPETGLTRIFIPARVTDNPALLTTDPGYINRLKASGSPELVRAWLEGDWEVLEGAFFPEFSSSRHVLEPFRIPNNWTRFRAGDWGSAKPYAFGWFALVQDDYQITEGSARGRILPRNAIVQYRELYGSSGPNIGLKQPAEQVARIIKSYDGDDEIAYSVLDPSAFSVVSGPSIGEVLARHGVYFRRADNSRTGTDKKMGGWDQVRARLRGDPDGEPMVYFFASCRAIIRTLPSLVHDENKPEDVDSDMEDHAPDMLRYACLSRPFRTNTVTAQDNNPLLVANAFKLHELR
jgi:hypothetical protein